MRQFSVIMELPSILIVLGLPISIRRSFLFFTFLCSHHQAYLAPEYPKSGETDSYGPSIDVWGIGTLLIELVSRELLSNLLAPLANVSLYLLSEDQREQLFTLVRNRFIRGFSEDDSYILFFSIPCLVSGTLETWTKCFL